MDLQFTSEELAFREEVQVFLEEDLSSALAAKVRQGKHLSKRDFEQWHASVRRRGWLANHWPVEYGGTGWTPTEKFIFENECALAGAPRLVAFGLSMLGPVLIKYGNEEQKKYWLPRILNGDDFWCQGYSEPDSGSDLASVRTSAIRDGNYYIVNGQKTWTTLGHFANMIFCLVRTNKDVKPQHGISFLLIDMNSPGIEVRPIITLDGKHEVNEVFFTDVKVPAENLVGEENKGWTYAKYLLTYERTNIAGVGYAIAELNRLKDTVRKVNRNGKALNRDPQFATRIAKVEIDLENLRTTNLRVLASASVGDVSIAKTSMLKVRSTEIRQEIVSLTRRAAGLHALVAADEALPDEHDHDAAGGNESAMAAAVYFNYRKLSIYGGSNEIQKNIVSKLILGL